MGQELGGSLKKILIRYFGLAKHISCSDCINLVDNDLPVWTVVSLKTHLNLLAIVFLFR